MTKAKIEAVKIEADTVPWHIGWWRKKFDERHTPSQQENEPQVKAVGRPCAREAGCLAALPSLRQHCGLRVGVSRGNLHDGRARSTEAASVDQGQAGIAPR